MNKNHIAERHGAAVPSLDRSLWEVLVATAKSYPNRDAVISLWQTGSNDAPQLGEHQGHAQGQDNTNTALRWTYEDLLHRAEALASDLRARGCTAGTPLVVFLGNSAEWALFFWAAARLCMPFVPLDPRGLADLDEVSKTLALVKPAVVVVADTEAAQTLARTEVIRDTCVRVQLSLSEPVEENGWTLLSNLASHHKTDPPTNKPPPSPFPELADIALIIFTSGTTYTPKGCLHTPANLLSQTNNYDPQSALTTDRWLVHTPVSHIFAINHTLRAWSRGDAVVFPSAVFAVDATLRALVDEKCTFMAAVPTMLRALVALPGFPGPEALRKTLTFVTMGGTTITEADIGLCRDQLGARDATQGFGLSEGAPVASWLRRDPLLAETGFHAGVGRVLPGASIRVCAPGERAPLLVGEVGELHIGGTSVVRGYLGRGASDDSFYSDDDVGGWWHVTGDQAMIDEDGILHVLGRYKDLVIRAGENIAPLKIENAITGIGGVIVSILPVL